MASYDGKILNGEGLLHLVGTIKAEIGEGGGSGGTTYTAGEGIDITNNVISTTGVSKQVRHIIASSSTAENWDADDQLALAKLYTDGYDASPCDITYSGCVYKYVSKDTTNRYMFFICDH